jgi:hypothetical protein
LLKRQETKERWTQTYRQTDREKELTDWLLSSDESEDGENERRDVVAGDREEAEQLLAGVNVIKLFFSATYGGSC